MSTLYKIPAVPATIGGGVNRGPQLLPIYWTQFAIALIFVALRFRARFSIRAIGWDDWTMATAMVLMFRTQSCLSCDANIVSLATGHGSHHRPDNTGHSRSIGVYRV